MTAPAIQGPHRGLATDDPRERFCCRLFDALWEAYRARVTHVAVYEQLIAARGATFVNDHIAFRTLALQQPACGIPVIARLFEALGYRPAACYDFPDKQLNAIHYQHPNPRFPKLFISELKVWELPAEARQAIARSVGPQLAWPPAELLERLAAGNDQAETETGNADGAADPLLAETLRCFHQLPWDPAERSDVELVNRFSQYGAWVLVHGHQVNHFTSLINSHGVPELDSIDKTVAALRAAGVPMKEEVEGEAGSKLRQSATAAAVVDVPVREAGRLTQMPWTYAYFELAERGMVRDAAGAPRRFEGFLGAQATHLFEMTDRGTS